VAPPEAGTGPIVAFAPFHAEGTDTDELPESEDPPAANAATAPTPESAPDAPAVEAPPPAADREPAD
jgi:hypothetical protein